MKYDLVGRKEIQAYLKLSTWRDVTSRMKSGLPVVQEPGERGRWLAVSSEIDAWIVSNAPKCTQMHQNAPSPSAPECVSFWPMETRESQYLDLIQSAAKANGIPARLVSAIVKIESSYEPWASRYEPAFYESYVRDKPVKVFGPCSKETEARHLATSWGLMQVMGSTARFLGFTGPFLPALCDPMVGLQWGCTLLKRLKARYLADHGWAGVVAAYNAGSVRKDSSGAFVNQAYVDKVLAAAGGAWPPKE